jgi:hypothetical protein
VKKAYSTYQKLIKADLVFSRTTANAEFTSQQATDLIRERVLSGEPLMISRFGANELNCILNYHFIHQGVAGNFRNILTGIPFFFNMNKNIIQSMNINAGFFPPTTENIIKYCQLSLSDLPEIDILGSWLNHEKFLYDYMPSTHKRVRLWDLSPVSNPISPWTIALKGKKVLVIHPFEETIKKQFKKRSLLFDNQELLPDFELKTLKAVQSVAGNGTVSGFKDWFEALESMQEKVLSIDFDFAILGCGAYGMPLAAFIKRMGKQAIHLGGETQIMFGIKGKRWEAPSYNYNNLFYNEHWTRPLNIDKPANAEKVEGACYW